MKIMGAIILVLIAICLTRSAEAQEVRCTIVAPKPKSDCTLKSYFETKGLPPECRGA